MDKYFFEAFEGMGRLAPGSEASTRKAMALFPRDDGKLEVLDIGCGNGIQTLLLAEEFPGASITAIDIHGPFIESLNRRAREAGLSGRVRGKVLSMLDMAFEAESFDLLWAEGSIYVAGFEKALRDWKRYLKPGGHLICSEVVWLTDTPSPESRAFWKEEYPQIGTVAEKTKQIEQAGYEVLGSFLMPREDWRAFYGALGENLEKMRKKYGSRKEALQVIEMMKREIDMYEAHSDEYGYAFFAMRKKNGS